MLLAMYRGPATDPVHIVMHWLICILTWSRYSHIELVIDGVCWSSSPRDGGVRSKVIDLKSGRWDVFPIEGDKDAALEKFKSMRGMPYGWRGALRVCPLLRWLPPQPEAVCCSESIAIALGLSDPETMSPQEVVEAKLA